MAQHFAFVSAPTLLRSQSTTRYFVNHQRPSHAQCSSGTRTRTRMVSAPESIRETIPSSAVPTTVDVVVIGAGPAGLSLSRALGELGVDVLCVDPSLDKPWPNNYGTWLDDLEPLGLAECTQRIWKNTTVYTQNSDEKTPLARSYARVDRAKLKRVLLEACEATGRVTILPAMANAVDSTDAEQSVVSLGRPGATGGDPSLPDVRARLVVDATGHALRFTKMTEGSASSMPGYQTAYGVEVELEDDLTAYSPDEMLLMDYRDAHMQKSAADRELSQREPTFLYVMPMGGRRVFFEETSLVASEPLSFDILKKRLYQRLDHYGVRVAKEYEEEKCLIPMGGSLPDTNHRVVGFGGSAMFVHPATGYMIARALSRASTVADAVSAALRTSKDADDIAQRVWSATWNGRLRQQRDFFSYGGEYLQKIDLDATREFFTAFFKIPLNQWAGFLSFRLEEPTERLMFGLNVFFNTSNRVRSQLVWDSFMHGGLPFFRSVLPIPFADPIDKDSGRN